MNELDLSSYKNHNFAVYCGYIDDNEKLLQSASGGIATAMAEMMVASNGYVAGVAYDATYENAEYILVNDVEGIKKLRGSKYVESQKNNIYRDVKALLEQDERVLFIGLPCEVGALRKIVGKEYDYLITCELICHGPTTQAVHHQYLQFLKNKYKSDIISFTVRYKKRGWTPLYLRAEFENGNVFEKPFYDTEYGVAFSIMSRKACFNCQFKGSECVGDIMIGDYWGLEKDNECWNDNGVSVVFVRTEKGETFIKGISNVKLFSTDFEHAIRENMNVVRVRLKPENYDSFSKMFIEHGLFYAVKSSQTPKARIFSMIKRVLPMSCVEILKKIKTAIRG